MNNIKHLAKQTAVYGLSSIFARLINYIITPLYTYHFLPEAYGVYASFYAYTALLLAVLGMGMETAYFRFHKQEKSFDVIMSFLLVIAFLFFLLVNLFAVQISGFLFDTTAAYVLFIRLFSGIIICDLLLALPFARLRLSQKALQFASFKLLNIVLTVLLNLFFILILKNSSEQVTHPFHQKLGNLYQENIGIGYAFIANLVASIVSILCFYKVFQKIKWNWNTSLLKPYLRYAMPLVLVSCGGIVNEVADRILLKIYVPGDEIQKLAAVGLYSAAYKIAILLSIFIQAFRYAAEPFFFKHHQQNGETKVYAQVMNYFTATTCLVLLFVVANLDWLQYFNAPIYKQGTTIVPILLFANLFLGMYYNLSVSYKLSDRTFAGAAIALFGSLITITINVIFIPYFSYVASAWATLICYASMLVLSYFWGQKFFRINYDLAFFIDKLNIGLSFV